MNKSEELIACLEGEIAKRDETIARLEPQLNRAIQANYDLREELAACRVSVENCEVFRARIAELECELSDIDFARRVSLQNEGDLAETLNLLRAELAAVRAKSVMPDVNLAAKALCSRHAVICGVDEDDQWKEYSQDFIADAETVLANSHLCAAPVSEAKAQGVEHVQWQVRYLKAETVSDGWWQDSSEQRAAWCAEANQQQHAKGLPATWEIRRFTIAAPVQQVSVPDWWRELLRDIEQFFEGAGVSPGPDIELRMAAMLAAAPAAPAADAGKLADAFLSWKLPDSVRPDGCAMDPTYPHRYGTNLMAWAQAKEMFEYVLVAHRAKGVV